MRQSKGSRLERETCRQLSLWFSRGKADDIYWRSQSSGARFTSRFKQGKQTYGQDGDIQAVNPIGKDLTDKISIECKCGYSQHAFTDVIDAGNITKKGRKRRPWEEFWLQAKRGAKRSGKKHFWLIVRRDRKETLLFMPRRTMNALQVKQGWTKDCIPVVPRFDFVFTFKDKETQAVAVQLDAFLKWLKPETVKRLSA
jgi:hypothetical protein